MFLRATTQERGYFSRECRELGVSRYAMYRHAHATGLMKARHNESKRFMEEFVESLRSQQLIGKHRTFWSFGTVPAEALSRRVPRLLQRCLLPTQSIASSRNRLDYLAILRFGKRLHGLSGNVAKLSC